MFFPLPLDKIWPLLKDEDRFVLLETQKSDSENYLSYLFIKPIALIQCSKLEQISNAFQKLEDFLNQGFYAAGFFSYEMGYGFENFKGIEGRSYFPLMWLAIYKQPFVFDHRKGQFCPDPFAAFKGSLRLKSAQLKYHLSDISLNMEMAEYIDKIRLIKEYIARGLTYQVNYTLKCKFKFSGSAFGLYQDLRKTQEVSYAAFIKADKFSILSFSPELFFRKDSCHIIVRPMKGTICRGRTFTEDKIQESRLKNSLKDRSENLMIVDLLRNDLGRVASVGTVKVDKLYTVEKYQTLLQMTSTVQAELKEVLKFYELFKSIFPSGSVTGAPKIRTMQIIRELEKEPRRVYTGAIGFLKPNKDAVFNVAIRTLLLKGTESEMGIGSGIVYDSDPEREYQECKLKAKFFTQIRQRGFALIETMLWSRKTGFFLLPFHLQRLRDSAKYFTFLFDENRIKRSLSDFKKQLNPNFRYRVRLLLFRNGNIDLTAKLILNERKLKIPKITLSKIRTNSADAFLYHKTTNRSLYSREYRRAKAAGFFDVIFENQKGEITEGAISNLFIKLDNRFYTPPVNSGLLAGVYRRYFIKKKGRLLEEKALRRQDLYQAQAIYLTNSVIGITGVKLET